MRIDTITLPAVWVSALVNGDYSGLDAADAAACDEMTDRLEQYGWCVVSTEYDAEPRFTNAFLQYAYTAGLRAAETFSITSCWRFDQCAPHSPSPQSTAVTQRSSLNQPQRNSLWSLVWPNACATMRGVKVSTIARSL